MVKRRGRISAYLMRIKLIIKLIEYKDYLMTNPYYFSIAFILGLLTAFSVALYSEYKEWEESGEPFPFFEFPEIYISYNLAMLLDMFYFYYTKATMPGAMFLSDIISPVHTPLSRVDGLYDLYDGEIALRAGEQLDKYFLSFLGNVHNPWHVLEYTLKNNSARELEFLLHESVRSQRSKAKLK